jgi:SprT-like family
MNREQAQAFIEAAHDRAWLRFRELYGNKVGKKPTIERNNRLRTTAGRAFLHDNKIDISTKLLLEFPSHFAKDTIPHEGAHFVAYRVFGEENHGKPWKAVMAAIGLPTSPYHNLVERLAVINNAREHGIKLPKKITLLDGTVVDTIDALLRVVNK